MWLVEQFVVRRLRAERLRSIATIVSVAAGVAVIVAVRLANQSVVRGFEVALEAMSGTAALEIVGSAVGLDENRLTSLGWLRRYGDVTPIIEGDAQYGRELVHVLGVDILRERPFREYRLVAGVAGAEPTPSAADWLELLRDASAVVVTESFARPRGIRVGDGVLLRMGRGERRFTVRGLLAGDGPARVVDNLVLMDIAAAQWALGRLGVIDRLDIRLADPGALDRAEAEIARTLPEGLTVRRPSQRGRQVEQMLAAFQLNLSALASLALLVGLFLVYNTVATSVIARRAEIGMLRAVGVTRSRVVTLFLFEALLLAVPGTLLGIAFGRVLAWGAVSLTATTVRTLYVAAAAAPPALRWADVTLAAGIALPLALAAAALPATEASRVTPLAAIGGAGHQSVWYQRRLRTIFVPMVGFAVGGWLSALGPIGGKPLAGYAAAFILVLSGAALVPLVLVATTRLLRRAAAGWRAVEPWLANESLAGGIPRLSVSVAALVVSLSMTVAVATMVGSFRHTVVYWVEQTLKADLFIGPGVRALGARQVVITPDVEQVVRSHAAISAVERTTTVAAEYDKTPIVLGAGDFAVMVDRAPLLFKAPRNGRAAMQAAIGRNRVIVSEAFAIRHRLAVGDTVALPTRSGAERFIIAAVYFDYSNDRGVVLMDRSTFTRHFGELLPTALRVYVRPGADPEQVKGELQSSIAPTHRLFVYTNGALRQEVLRIFDSTFAIAYALELIAVLVAMLGIAGTLLTLVLDRGQELALLRLLGAERKQVHRMVVIEAGLLGVLSQMLALAVGAAVSLVLVYVINLQSFGWTIQFHVPVSFLVQLSAIIVAATIVAGLYPARRASATPAVELSHEE